MLIHCIIIKIEENKGYYNLALKKKAYANTVNIQSFHG